MSLPPRLLASVYRPPAARAPWTLPGLTGAEVRYFSFGRRALAAALQPGWRVLLPEFICRDLLSSLAAAGAAPLYYRVARNLSPQDAPERWPQADAVLAVDYFGFPQDLAPFRRYAERTKAVVIEDNAHGLLSRDASGRWLGLRADYGIFSLRKSLLLPNGAALAAAPGRPLPAQEPFGQTGGLRRKAKGAVRVAAAALGPRAAHESLRLFRAARGPVSVDPEAERRLPEPASACRELSLPLRAADPGLEAERRRELYRGLDERLRAAGAEPVFGKLPEGAVPYGYPYRASDAAKEAVERALRAVGLSSLPWPDLPDAVAPQAPGHYRDVRLVHFLW